MDSDSEPEEEPQVQGIPATIILINIYDPNSRKSSERAHVATCQLIHHNLRTQSSHYLGVFLYGTDNEDTSIFAVKCLKNIFSLTSPTLDDYNKLEKTKLSSIKQSRELVLSEVLSQCRKMFSACKKTVSSRTIIMLTALDEPPAAYDQNPTLECVVDLVDSNIQLKVVNIAECIYEIDQFYQDFLFEANKGQDVALPNPVWDYEDIKKLLIIQSHRHLAIAEIPFEICKDVTMGVKVYKLLKSNTQPKTTYLHKETYANVKSSIKTMKYTKETSMDVDQDQGQESKQVPLLKTEALRCQEYGGERVEFTDNERGWINNPFGPNTLKLLGFKPANLLKKEKWFITNCYFLFPSEHKIEGSTIAFKALYQACMKMKVVAICMLLTRVNSKPKLVALSPSIQPFGLSVDLGFDVIIIPFAENVQDVPDMEDDEEIEISNEQRTNMNDIINKLMFQYKPEMFENPMLQSKYRILEAKALQDTFVTEICDTTKPNETLFENLDDDEFDKLFGPFGAVATKRVTDSEASGSVQKKTKMNQIIDHNVLRDNIANKKLNKQYTVEQLKEILRSLNITKLPKKKDDLVKLVYEHYN